MTIIDIGVDIKPKTQWQDKKDNALTVLSVDHKKGELVFNRPDSPDVKRTVSIEVFTSQTKPIDYKPAPAVKAIKDIVKNELARRAWIDDAPSNFGNSPNLQLSNQEWLERGMHAKTIKFDIGAGGLPPEVNWEDRCAAIASIDNKPAKALASILLWGSDTNWDWSRHFDDVVKHLAANTIRRCKQDGRSEPKACVHSLSELARLMARMVLHFELYDLWDVYTVKGRLRFSGIEVNASTYTNSWLTYQRQIMDDLINLVIIADDAVYTYRRELNQA